VDRPPDEGAGPRLDLDVVLLERRRHVQARDRRRDDAGRERGLPRLSEAGAGPAGASNTCPRPCSMLPYMDGDSDAGLARRVEALDRQVELRDALGRD
jgi:hypothetical protein